MVDTFAAAVSEPASARTRAQNLASSYVDVVRCLGIEWREVLKSRSRVSWRSRRSQEAPMSSLAQDIRYAMRQFTSRPGFAAIVVFVLGVGIGATSAVFSVVNGVLLEPLPYRDPDRLVLLWGHMSATEVTKAPWSGPDLTDFRARARSFESLAAASGFKGTLTGDFEPEPIELGMATANFFDVLGVEPVLGRSFRPEDQQNLARSSGFRARLDPAPRCRHVELRALGAPLRNGPERARPQRPRGWSADGDCRRRTSRVSVVAARWLGDAARH
jgi:hypothetical protein